METAKGNSRNVSRAKFWIIVFRTMIFVIAFKLGAVTATVNFELWTILAIVCAIGICSYLERQVAREIAVILLEGSDADRNQVIGQRH